MHCRASTGQGTLVQVVAPLQHVDAARRQRLPARQRGDRAPGARYNAEKITKLATSRLAGNMISLRPKNRQRIPFSQSRPGCPPGGRTGKRTTRSRP